MWIPSSQMACSHAMADRERSLFLVVGLPAAGKSTVGGLLARRFERGVHVEGDFFKRMIVSGRAKPARTPSDEWWSQMRLRCRMGAAVADSCLAAGFTVVAQDLVIGPLLSEYVGFIRSRPLLVVVLAPRAEVLAAREGARDKNGYGGDVSIEEADALLRATTPRIGLWLDTSDQSPEQTVDEILRRAWAEGSVA